MNKELIDIAWSCLPREFKEEVKRMYKSQNASYRVISSSLEKLDLKNSIEALEYVFGIHNLTSDAEGEEMLCVPRKKVQEMYAANERIKTDFPDKETGIISDHINHILGHLFGSKCLLDEEKSVEFLKPKANSDFTPIPVKSFASKWDKAEPQPAEPKFTKGDMVHCKSFGYEGDYKVLEYTGGPRNCYDCIDKYGAYYRFYESDLEPYTEPTDNPIPPNSGELESQEADKHFDSIHKDGFAKERRLNIAAMAMQGILSNPNSVAISTDDANQTSQEIAKYAVLCANALIQESEKGDSK